VEHLIAHNEDQVNRLTTEGKMIPWLFAVTVACYLGIAANYVRQGEWFYALAFVGYALGNAGLTWAAFKY
jgi:hypothetical protein